MEAIKTSAGGVGFAHAQDPFVVVGAEGENDRLLTEVHNLLVFESLRRAGPLVQDLQEQGIAARMTTMTLCGFYYLAQGLETALWVLRHDGTLTTIDDITFPWLDDETPH